MIYKIPPEILVKVFEHLTQKELKDNVSVTCRQWRTVVQDFLLVENRVKVDSPFNYSFSKLLKHIDESPVFGRSITSLVMKDHYQCLDDKNHAFYYDFGIDKIHLISEACTNLRELEIVSDGLDFENLLEQIFDYENSLIRSKIKIFKVDFDHNSNFDGDSPWMMDEMFSSFIGYDVRTLDMTKLTNCTANNLHELINSNSVDGDIEPLVFVKDNMNLGDNFFLTTITIVCPHFGMTKACLEFFTSGQLAVLQDLNLCAILLTSIGENESMFIISEYNRTFDALEQFCQLNLKHYNIALQNLYGKLIFQRDNCKDLTERYSYKLTSSNDSDDNDLYII